MGNRRADSGDPGGMASIGGAIGKRSAAVIVAVVVTLLVFSPVFYPPLQLVLLDRLESENFDLRFRVRGAETPGPETVVVAADEKTAAAFGRWPFSRRYFATAIDRLKADGAKVIAFDVIFPQAELAMPEDVRTQLGTILQALPPDSVQATDLKAVLDAPGPDDAMAQSMQNAGNVVLGFALDHGDAEVPGLAEAPAYVEDWAYGRINPRPDGSNTVALQAIGVQPPV